MYAPPFALFDDTLTEAGDLWLSQLSGHVRCCAPERLSAFFDQVHAWQAAGAWVALVLPYELGYALEPDFHPWIKTGAVVAEAFAFECAQWHTPQQTTARGLALLMQRGTDPALAKTSDWVAGLSWPEYAKKIAAIHALIREGECYQINFTYPLTATFKGDPLALYWRLRETQPVRFGAFLQQGQHALLSRSPELFVARQGHTLTCRPMKGTCGPDEPDEALHASEKNRAENLMIVDLIRNDLGRLVPPGGVRVPALFTVEHYRTLKQMTSTIQASPTQASLAQILTALFPCGSITGAPKYRAMEHIRRLETGPRGLYCGALGWLAPNGDFRLSVPIRTLTAQWPRTLPDGLKPPVKRSAQGRLCLHVGSGITADATADHEWEECRLKARFAEVSPALALIETLRCEWPEGKHGGPAAGFVFPFLEAHLQRLAHSARALGFACPLTRIRCALHDCALGLQAGSGVWRVRLVLSRTGVFTIETAPLPSPPSAPVQIGVSPVRLDPAFPWLAHKTTARHLYEYTLAQAEKAGLFDVIFLNKQGWICEGTRSSVFIRLHPHAPWLTPERACGLLPGVFRAHLLAQGQARAARFDLAALRKAPEIALGNALRGLIPARLVIDTSSPHAP